MLAGSKPHGKASRGWVSFTANIVGGVFGCLLAGFYLLRVHNMAIATVVAATINGLVALIAFVLAAWMPNEVPKVQAEPYLNSRSPDGWAVYIAIALSGMTALSAEVVWTRLLSLLLGGTIYTFALILAVFLAGLGLGSSAGSFLTRTAGRPRMLLGGCQLLLPRLSPGPRTCFLSPCHTGPSPPPFRQAPGSRSS